LSIKVAVPVVPQGMMAYAGAGGGVVCAWRGVPATNTVSSRHKKEVALRFSEEMWRG